MYEIEVFSIKAVTIIVAAPWLFKSLIAEAVEWWIARGSSSSKDTFDDCEVLLSELDGSAITKGPKIKSFYFYFDNSC